MTTKVKNILVEIVEKISPAKLLLGSLLMASIPFATYAATDTKSTTINANVGSAISMTTSGTVTINVTPTSGGSQSSASDTVLVSTNNETGYTLTLANSDAATALTSGGNTIPAHTGTLATPTALANNTWGYRVDGAGGFGSGPTTALNNAATSTQTFAGVSPNSSPSTIKNSSVLANNDETLVWYSVKVDASQANGSYSDTVTYTATTNP